MTNELLVTLFGLFVMLGLGGWAWLRFKPHTDERIAQRQLQEAKQARLQHIAAAEHHKALADMYGTRARRLEREYTQVKLVPFVFEDTQFGGLL